MVRDALRRGAEEIVLGLGGSASTDGGAGLAQALGARLLDQTGAELGRGGGALRDVGSIDVARLRETVGAARFVVACDVDNPLVGPRGTAVVFGPQKGAQAPDIAALDAGLRRWAAAVAAATGADHSGDAGSGAAGGTGFAAIALLGAQTRRGIDLVLDLTGFSSALDDAALVVTGEGSLDDQTLGGKAPMGVAAAANARGVPVVAVAGRCLLTTAQLDAAGIAACYPLSDLEPDPGRSMQHAADLLTRVGRRVAADWLA